MFTKGIYTTALTGEAADRLFANITDYNTPDQSFLATLRALLRKRLPPDESVYLCCKQVYLSLSEISAMSTSQNMGHFIPPEITHQTTSSYNIIIVNAAVPHAICRDMIP